MPADITSLTEGWLELESDPGRLSAIMTMNLHTNFVLFFTLKVFSRSCWKILAWTECK